MRRKEEPAKAPLLEIPGDLEPKLRPIAQEISRLHENVLWSAQGQFEQMKLWRAMNALLGVPAAVLAAVSGGTGLAGRGSRAGPAILALIAAGFGGALTTLNPSRRVSQAQAAASVYLELQTQARQLLTIDLPDLSREEARVV
ncbi:MAG: SLATT domain-containing protein, partial [Actinomycetota bacterium]|nr:SLATT domain-containing protein [Actinomycetota bacterium]